MEWIVIWSWTYQRLQVKMWCVFDWVWVDTFFGSWYMPSKVPHRSALSSWLHFPTCSWMNWENVCLSSSPSAVRCPGSWWSSRRLVGCLRPVQDALIARHKCSCVMWETKLCATLGCALFTRPIFLKPKGTIPKLFVVICSLPVLLTVHWHCFWMQFSAKNCHMQQIQLFLCSSTSKIYGVKEWNHCKNVFSPCFWWIQARTILGRVERCAVNWKFDWHCTVLLARM